MAWTYYWATGAHSAQPDYHQFQYGGCLVGCGGVAWAMLFGWGDRQAHTGNSYWAGRTGLYLQNGGRSGHAVAPLTQDAGVRNMIIEIRNDIGTWCAFGNGATNPWDMWKARNYLSGRTATTLTTHYNVFGIHDDGLRVRARNSIRDRKTPAIIGTGWLTHYPLAYGYAWQTRTIRKCFIFCWNETVTDRWFYVNQGWSGTGADGWVATGTWFAGEIYP